MFSITPALHPQAATGGGGYHSQSQGSPEPVVVGVKGRGQEDCTVFIVHPMVEGHYRWRHDPGGGHLIILAVQEQEGLYNQNKDLMVKQSMFEDKPRRLMYKKLGYTGFIIIVCKHIM
jgi:hypothetical protein